MKLSHRVQSLKPSATIGVTNKAKAMKAQGIDVLAFSAGEPDFDTPAKAKQAAIDALQAGQTKYAPSPGTPLARAAIAKKLTEKNGIKGITADHVLIGSGGKHVLYLLMQSLFDFPAPNEKPLELLLPTPAWVSYAPQAELAGGKVVEIEGDREQDFKITPDQLRAAITPQSRAFIFNSPSNPTGVMYTPDEIRALAAVVAEAAKTTAPDLLIIADEIYERILLTDTPHLSIGSIPEVADRTVTVNGMAKAYAMTGWRLGYAACPGKQGATLIKALSKIQTQINTAATTFAMAAIPACFAECDADVEAMRQAFITRGELMHRRIMEIPGIACPKPTGAFYVFPDISAHFGSVTPQGRTIDSPLSFADALLEEHRIAVVPGEDFLGAGKNCIRLSFACSEEQINKGLDQIATFVASLQCPSAV